MNEGMTPTMRMSPRVSSLLHPISLHSLPQKRSLHPTQVEKETNQVSDDPPRTENREKTPCALHAAGHCRFGERCRNLHTGEPGSEAARKAFSEYQSAKGGKGDKGKGKKKGDKKGGKGSKSNLSTPAAVAAATSTVTITEVEGRKVMSAWEGFCSFCRKALPSLDMFLKLSIPILATVVSSVVNSIDKIGEASAAAMLKEPIKDFRTFSLEFLGDTGAAYDIGSLRALEEQGIDLKMIEPWIKVLDHPINFSTGGGQQMATEAIRMYCENLGELHMHLLSIVARWPYQLVGKLAKGRPSFGNMVRSHTWHSIIDDAGSGAQRTTGGMRNGYNIMYLSSP